MSVQKRARATLSAVCLATTVAASTLVVTGCRTMTPAELDTYGTHRYEGRSKPEVIKAVRGALRGQGYDIVEEDDAAGHLKTAPKLVTVTASGNEYGAVATSNDLAWTIDVETRGADTLVHATPRGYQAGQSIDATKFNYGFARKSFDSLFKEIDGELGVKSTAGGLGVVGAGAPPRKGVALVQPPDSSGTSARAEEAAPAPAERPSYSEPAGELDTRWSVAPMLGYLSQNLNVGLGIRGGKTLDNHIYLGGTFVYQFGESGTVGTQTVVGGQVVGSSASWSTSGFYVGPEGGYDFALDRASVVLRPYMGLGLFSWSSSATTSAGSAGGSSTQFVVWPGFSVLWSPSNSDFFLGGDLRMVSVPGAAFGLYAMGGMHFGS